MWTDISFLWINLNRNIQMKTIQKQCQAVLTTKQS